MRLFLDILPGPLGMALTLTDENGVPLPNQATSDLLQDQDGATSFTVTFVVDHFLVAFRPAARAAADLAQTALHDEAAPAADAVHVEPPEGSVMWRILKKHLPGKYQGLISEGYDLAAGPEPEDARREFERRFSLAPGTLGNTTVRRVEVDGAPYP